MDEELMKALIDGVSGVAKAIDKLTEKVDELENFFAPAAPVCDECNGIIICNGCCKD